MSSPSVSKTSRKPGLKITAVALILLLSLGSYFAHQWYQDKQWRLAEQKWLDTQAYAKEMGVELDLNTYIDSHKGEGTALIDDHPWLQELFDSTKEPHNKLVDIPGLDVGEIGLTHDHAENLRSIRKALQISEDEQLTEKELAQRLLDAMSPANEELDNFVSAVMESTDYGSQYLKDSKGYVMARITMDLVNRLTVRGYAHLVLDSGNSSDLEALIHFHKLDKQHASLTLIGHTVSIATDLQITGTIAAYAFSPEAKAEVIAKLLKLHPLHLMHPTFREMFRDEIPAVLVMMEDAYFNEDQPQESSGFDSLGHSKASPLITHNLRSDYVRFMIDHFLRPSSPRLIAPGDLDSIDDINDPRISHYSLPSRTALSIVTIGFSYYYHNSMKSDMMLSSYRLALATRLYQLENGDYPKDLSQLSPEYLAELPTIPHSGEAYSYIPPSSPELKPNFTGSLQFGDKMIETNWLNPIQDK
ncbi:hypothetical protein Rhal01_02306 [Rubritalea halochordaticola]|uniref:Uncharacterized protein n=1 Tax=Rubritalea halochordaticola TaxID=714537 RepID=A0ABP9V099_9BACT